MKRDEPQMGQACVDEPVATARQLEPFEETGHLLLQPMGGRRLEVQLAPPDRTGHSLHRP
jgi:hypothetical protein